MFLLIFFLLFAYAFYVNLIKPPLYWRRKGIFYVKPWWRYCKLLFSSKSFVESVKDSYNEFPERRYFGSYQFFKPALFVRDLDLIKQITVKDFEHFPDHLNFIGENAEPILSHNLFNLKGEKWRAMRSTLSPAFTSAKMRSMYTLIQETAEDFVKFFALSGNEVIELEMKNVFSRYANDVIANCAFGIRCDSLKEEENQFFTMGSKIIFPKGVAVLRNIFGIFFPAVFEFFKIPLFPPDVTEFFMNIITETISTRQEKNIIRPDMIHLLMEARKGKLRHEKEKTAEASKDESFATVEESNQGKSSNRIELTDEVVAAQALVFFFAGFDTSSTLLTFLSYELALNPDVQAKLQGEVDEATGNGTKSVTYDEILQMKYLDQVVCEALRKYPPAIILSRLCTKDYKIEANREDEIDFVLDKGCLVSIPVAGLHQDPKYFPEPNRFNPDRFSDENKGNIVPGSYLPFGSGPRNCIGSRFALLEAKSLTVNLMVHFDIVPVRRTRIPVKFAKTLNLVAKDGVWLGFKKRNK